MSLLDLLSSREEWEKFYAYKASLKCPKSFKAELRRFIDAGAYIPVCEAIRRGDRFPLPKKSVISKLSSQKKRTVYTYPYGENIVLKLLTYLLTRRYDGVFSDGLYSFRPNRTAKDAIRKLTRTRGIGGMYSYKVDIHDYFNSVPVEKLIPMLSGLLADDRDLLSFLGSLLNEPYVLDHGREICEKKGIMAGTPLSAFYANLYLRGLDAHFEKLGVPYARYSDDIIVFAQSQEETQQHAEYIKNYLYESGLSVNPEKENFGDPSDGFVFLGFAVTGDTIDIAPATVKKLKQKMRRKARALARWKKRSEADGERAAAAFIRIFNRKLLEGPHNNELTWSCWFFSVINTTKSLKEIDLYAQDCIRFLISGTRTKSRYNVRYEDMKKLGCKNLVHAYYDYTNEQKETQNA